jgi:hypothetical protein
MAELLIRVQDSQTTGDVIFDSQVSRRGDVIVAMPDDWPWGDMELTHPFWRILKISNVTVSDASVLTSPEIEDDPLHPRRTLQFRMNSFDIDGQGIPVPLKNYLNDDTRVQPTFSFPGLNSASFAALVKRKPKIPDPGAV